MIQRIFPSEESAQTHYTIIIRGLPIHLFSFIDEVGFSSQKGLLCLYHNKKKYMVQLDISLVSYRVEEKRNSISTNAHVLFPMYDIIFNYDILILIIILK